MPKFGFIGEYNQIYGKSRKEDESSECSGELEAYGYVYSLSSTAITVLSNTDVIFTRNGPLENITHSPNTIQVFIRKSGVYQVYYGVNNIAGNAAISLAVNGAVHPSATIPLDVTESETSGKVLLNLRTGDFLALRNNSAGAITLAVAPAVGAQLTLVRIDKFRNWAF